MNYKDYENILNQYFEEFSNLPSMRISHIEHISNKDKGLKQMFRTPLGGFVNHSEDPNCIKVKQGSIWYLETLRHINPGEELTLKYTFYSIAKE